MAAGMACADGAGRDGGNGEDFRDDPRCTEPTDTDGGGIVRTKGREPRRDRRNRSTDDHGGAGRTYASGGETARCARTCARRGETARCAGTRGYRTAAARATGGGRATRDDRAATARPCAGRNRTAAAKRRAQH